MSDEINSNFFLFSLVGGIVGGIVMAMPMLMMSFPTNPPTSNMIEMISLAMGSPSLLIGFVMHMMFSLVYGIIFGVIIYLLVNQFNQNVPSLLYFVIIGAVFSLILWVIGPVIVMPMMMGNKFGHNLDQVMLWGATMMGHLIYGIVLGVVVGYLQQRS